MSPKLPELPTGWTRSIHERDKVGHRFTVTLYSPDERGMVFGHGENEIQADNAARKYLTRRLRQA